MSSTTDGERVKRETTDTWRVDDLGVKVEKIEISRADRSVTRFDVFRKRKQAYTTLDGSEIVERDRWQKVAELSEQDSTEVLFGLAEVHGYDLEGK
jgi:hypothetical protein